jgi:hypothetical protein
MWLKGGDIVNKSFDDFLKSLDFEALAKKHATTLKKKCFEVSLDIIRQSTTEK